MKKILMALVTLASVNSFALDPKDPYYVCNRINSGSLKTQCLSTISGQYVDPLAAGACDRIKDASTTVQCMSAIVNLSFDRRAVEGCDSIPEASQTIQCLRQVGQPTQGGINPGPRPDAYRKWVKEVARYAIHQLDSGNLSEVRRVLNDLLIN